MTFCNYSHETEEQKKKLQEELKRKEEERRLEEEEEKRKEKLVNTRTVSHIVVKYCLYNIVKHRNA